MNPCIYCGGLHPAWRCPTKPPYSETQAMTELGKLDYERTKMDNMTPQQEELAEKAFQETLERWKGNDGTGSVTRFFFFAGAQLGVALAMEIDKEVHETFRTETNSL